MPLFGKRTARRKEIRRSKAERGLTLYHRIREQLQFQPLTLLVLWSTLAAIAVNIGEDPLRYRPGERLPRDVVARVSFRVRDESLTTALKMRAREAAEDYYTLDAALLQDLRGRLSTVFRLARENLDDRAALRSKAAEIGVPLDEAGLDELLRLATQQDSDAYQRLIDRALQTLASQPLVEAGDPTFRGAGGRVVLVDAERATERPISGERLFYTNNREQVAAAVHTVVETFPAALRESLRTLLLRSLRVSEGTYRPVYVNDAARSEKAAQDAENAVQMQYAEFVAGTRLAPAGVLTADGWKLLQQENDEFLKLRGSDPTLRARHRLAVFCRAALVFLAVFAGGSYILVQHQQGIGNLRRRLVTGLALVILLYLARFIYVGAQNAYFVPGAQALAAGMLAIMTTQAPIYAATGLLALMITVATGQGPAFLIVLIVTSVVLMLGLRGVRHRGRIIAVGTLAAAAAAITSVLAGLVELQPAQFILSDRAVWAALTVLGAAFLLEGILPGLERLFGVTTNMTLLEWCDPTKPLLRMLAAESPGTYNHSLLVGTLADAAAESIGANGLLARAGSYYHDIGKINKPEYFVENQAAGGGSRHDRLSPAMSHLIIVGHVKDGIEMAKEYGLPAALHPFIPEHHGTCVVEYFYHAAKSARKPDDPEVPIEQFRYPGPKPQSRETAIVMMCDTVEGAVRSMSEPTPNRIEETVAKLVQKRMMDGQFDECDLTFRELETIRDSLVRSLCSIYHGRIAYPSGVEEKEGETRRAS